MGVQNKTAIDKIVVCPDKFKGGPDSLSVSCAIKRGIEGYLSQRCGISSVFSEAPTIRCIEMADGGDGSARLFGKLCNAREVFLRACGPLGEEVETSYMLCDGPSPISPHPSAFIECARICGLAMVEEGLRNPLKTTTFGLGQLVLDAIGKGAETICVGLGGSATNDLGTGMLQALGFEMGLGSSVKATGGTLGSIKAIGEIGDKELKKKLASVKFLIINDVDNPLLGPRGATYVYSAQKGADEKSMARMEKDADSLLDRISLVSASGKTARQTSLQEGAGAAGGLGFAFMHFLGAGSESGFSFFGNRLQGLTSLIEEADLLISGEGSVDSQSLMGKVVGGVCRVIKLSLRKKEKSLMLFCGESRLGIEELARASGCKRVAIQKLSDIEPDIRNRIGREIPLLEKEAFLSAKELDTTL